MFNLHDKMITLLTVFKVMDFSRDALCPVVEIHAYESQINVVTI
jgi:hypothetical protein